MNTIRPGLLVSLKTSLKGNVSYDRQDIEKERVIKEGELKGATRAVWETQRIIVDPTEHAAGGKARDKARGMIKNACIWTAFGLLCPENKMENLERSIADARRVAEDFNVTSKLSKLEIFVITGRIARDDEEAARAIKSEVRELMQTMEEGLKNLNVKVVREAANQLRSVGQMLSDESKDKVTIAIEAARKAANIAAKAAKAGEQAALEVDLVTIKKIAEQRTAFLDLDNAKEVATPTHAGRAVDLEVDLEVNDKPAEVKGDKTGRTTKAQPDFEIEKKPAAGPTQRRKSTRAPIEIDDRKEA